MVAQVAGVALDREGEVALGLVRTRDLVGVVVARVVEDENLVDAGTERRGESVEDGRDRGGGVVGDDENPDPFHRLPPRQSLLTAQLSAGLYSAV
jgi:hypothetical protein